MHKKSITIKHKYHFFLLRGVHIIKYLTKAIWEINGFEIVAFWSGKMDEINVYEASYINNLEY